MSVTSPRRRFRSLSAIVIMGLIAAALSVIGGASTAFADGGTATVSGTVTSSATSEGLAGVTVQINSQDFSYFDTAGTAADGKYTLTGIPAGSYTLRFRASDGANFVEKCWQINYCNVGLPTYFALDAGQALTGIDAALDPGATVNGTVDSANTGAGLPNVSVSASSAAGSFGSAQTDSSGNYSIHGLAGGDYTLEFQPSQGNYLTQWWNNQPTFDTANALPVAAGATVSHVDAHLAAGATISGTVSAAGSPLAGAAVYAVGTGTETANATTGSDGTYTISALTAGSYTIEFVAPQGDNYATQYWEGASTLTAATPVSVTSSAPATGIDATLSAGASISGTIFAPGTPKVGLANAMVTVYLSAGGGPVTNAVTDEQGQYSIIGLPAGRYSIGINPSPGENAAAEWWGGSFTQTGAKSLTLTTGQSRTGIDQQLIVGSTISGTVLGAGSSPQPLGGVDVTIWASDQIWGKADIPPFETTTDASGDYTFPNLGPGKYTVLFFPSDPNFTGQWWNNKPTQSKATRLEVTKNVDVAGVGATLAPMVITPGTPHISGKAHVGVTLSAHPGNWKPNTITFSYQWLRNGSAIAGATSATYIPTSSDVGDALVVAVTGTAPAFQSEGLSQTVTRAATKPVKPVTG